jgi:hypothetical protein
MTIRPLTAVGATTVSVLALAASEPGETRPPGWEQAAPLLVRPLVVAP